MADVVRKERVPVPREGQVVRNGLGMPLEKDEEGGADQAEQDADGGDGEVAKEVGAAGRLGVPGREQALHAGLIRHGVANPADQQAQEGRHQRRPHVQIRAPDWLRQPMRLPVRREPRPHAAEIARDQNDGEEGSDHEHGGLHRLRDHHGADASRQGVGRRHGADQGRDGNRPARVAVEHVHHDGRGREQDHAHPEYPGDDVADRAGLPDGPAKAGLEQFEGAGDRQPHDHRNDQPSDDEKRERQRQEHSPHDLGGAVLYVFAGSGDVGDDAEVGGEDRDSRQHRIHPPAPGEKLLGRALPPREMKTDRQERRGVGREHDPVEPAKRPSDRGAGAGNHRQLAQIGCWVRGKLRPRICSWQRRKNRAARSDRNRAAIQLRSEILCPADWRH